MTAHDVLRLNFFGLGAVRALTAAVFAFATTAASAGPGHDHDHDHAAPAATGPASPRFAAQSDVFELVGIAQEEKLTLYLDRFANNAPVADATIEVEMQLAAGAAPTKAQAKATTDGTYEIAHPQLAKPGAYALQFTVTAGKETDLLAGNLTIPDPHAGHDHTHGVLNVLRSPVVMGGIALLLLGAIRFVAVRVLRKRRQQGALA